MTTAAVEGECIDGIQLLYVNEDRDFFEAQAICESFGEGGNLAIPTDEVFTNAKF